MLKGEGKIPPSTYLHVDLDKSLALYAHPQSCINFCHTHNGYIVKRIELGKVPIECTVYAHRESRAL